MLGLSNTNGGTNINDNTRQKIIEYEFLRSQQGQFMLYKVTQGADGKGDGINKFGSHVEQIFHGNRQRLVRQKLSDEEIFSEIQGYEDIKKLIMRCILSSEPVHVILDGPSASGKTIFLLSMQKKLHSSYFVDCTNATGPGMIDYLFKHDVKYLLLDEVEKMSKSNQNVLLNVLNWSTYINKGEKDRKQENESICICNYK
jgi:hypothetical protein